MPLDSIRPAEVNDRIYKPVDPDDPDVLDLADDIREAGQLEEIVITLDNVILSGHRRYVAVRLAGLDTIRVRRDDITSTDPGFVDRLVRYNNQRVKTADEVFREEIVRSIPEDAHRRLIDHRTNASKVKGPSIALGEKKHRAAITKAKQPFLDAILKVLDDLDDYLPVSDRQIHYALLNDPPQTHASKPGSAYRNDFKSYKSLTELLTRARLIGLIPFESIHDPTRPVATWNVWPGVRGFIRSEVEGFLRNYYLDLQRTQPVHIEIVGEKNTIESTIRPIASEYCIPYTIGRGYSSLPPRRDMAERFRKTGKERLLILFMSDLDPEGEDIARSFTRSMRDDFGITNVDGSKVALTPQQVLELGIQPQMKAKAGSSRRKAFVRQHGENVFELEAAAPDQLQRILRDAINAVIDQEAYRASLQQEAAEAVELEALKIAMQRYFAGLIGQEKAT